MKYQSKKDPEIIAAFDCENKKFNTTRLIYLTGDKKGKSFDVSNSTLKRWWKKVENDVETEEVVEPVSNPLNIDFDKVNEPYHPNVTPHYIPKPESVIEYEEKKHKKYNASLPTFEELTDMFGPYLKKANKTYLVFKTLTSLHRKGGCIMLYACESDWDALTHLGLTSSPNKDKDRPFAFKIVTEEEFEKAKGVLTNGEDKETT